MEYKSLSLSSCEVKFDADSGVFEGYASVFDGVDSYGDTILAGAYKKTLKQFGIPKMFWNHDKYSVPPGKFTEAKEDAKGLFVRGEFTPGNQLGEQIRLGLKHGTIDGLSIGYHLRREDYSETAQGGRIIKNMTQLAEVSIVNFPADKSARVTGVKSEDIEAVETIRDFERLLRDVAGFTKAEAQTLIAKAKTLFTAGGSGTQERSHLDLLKRFEAIHNRIN